MHVSQSLFSEKHTRAQSRTVQVCNISVSVFCLRYQTQEYTVKHTVKHHADVKTETGRCVQFRRKYETCICMGMCVCVGRHKEVAAKSDKAKDKLMEELNKVKQQLVQARVKAEEDAQRASNAAKRDTAARCRALACRSLTR
jgi:hypothetical protein